MRPSRSSARPCWKSIPPRDGRHAQFAYLQKAARLEQALHDRRPVHRGGLVHHNDRGQPERLAQAPVISTLCLLRARTIFYPAAVVLEVENYGMLAGRKSILGRDVE